MKLFSVRRLGGRDGVFRSQVVHLRHQSGLLQAIADVVPLQVDIRVDLVGNSVVALIAIEAAWGSTVESS